VKLKRLETLHDLAWDWIQKHLKPEFLRDKDRGDLLEKLVLELAGEQRQLSQAAAKKMYLDDIRKEGGFSGLSGEARGAVTPKMLDLVRKKSQLAETFGLTDAELIAIRIFTCCDYGYINPSTAVDKEWLRRAMAGAPGHAGAFESLSAEGGLSKDQLAAVAENDKAFEIMDREGAFKELFSQGPIHAAVATAGLEKIPNYTKTLWRGQSLDENEMKRITPQSFTGAGFQLKGPPWGHVEFNTISSGTKTRGTANRFSEGNVGSAKPFAVVFVLDNAGGKDISEISAQPKASKEDEVTILAGTKLAVTDVITIPGTKGLIYEVHAG
jgi:hypothetical protein